jgi:hypothetical protein
LKLKFLSKFDIFFRIRILIKLLLKILYGSFYHLMNVDAFKWKSFGSTKVGVNLKDILQYFKIVHKEIIPNFPYNNFSLPTQNFLYFEFLKSWNFQNLYFKNLKHAHAKLCFIDFKKYVFYMANLVYKYICWVSYLRIFED